MLFLRPFFLLSFLALGTAFASALMAQQAETTCARIELKIDQELTLEREGFEAKLALTNGSDQPLGDFELIMHFTDADRKPVAVTTDATSTASDILFFYHYTGPGATVPPSIEAGKSVEITYLIVPSLKAADDPAHEGQELRDGRLYYVGATIKYKQAGVPTVIEVAPDSITVRPMPRLELEYFLPGAVHGDDPTTPGTVEPVVPFPLGVRVVNHSSAAAARKLKILSAEPVITKNDGELGVEYKVIGAEVNGQPAQPVLLADFGDVSPQRSALGSWIMTCTLEGRFTKLNGRVSHAAEFGGGLTSLIPEDDIATYRLLGRVLVDFPGSDDIADFLAVPNMEGVVAAPNVYASDNHWSPAVADSVSQPPMYYVPGLSLSGKAVAVGNITPPSGASAHQGQFFFYARVDVSSSYDGQIATAVRNDGKVLPSGNAWVSKVKSGGVWAYTLNIFDCLVGQQTALGYELSFSAAPPAEQAPEITFSQAGTSVNGPIFIVKNNPLNVTVSVDNHGRSKRKLELRSGNLPYGAAFDLSATERGLGSLTWTPVADQVGSYDFFFTAQDDLLRGTRSLSVRVVDQSGGTYDAWAISQWGPGSDPAISGQEADPDHDDLPNLLEYALAGDPKRADDSILPIIGSTEIDGETYLTITYTHITSDPLLTIKVVGASAAYAPASQWAVINTPPLLNQLNALTGLRTVTMRDLLPLSAPVPHRYLRLQVTR